MQKRTISPITLFLLLVVLILGILLVRSNVSSSAGETVINVNSAPPSAITFNYQGQLRDDTGDTINGTLPMRFSLYDVATGGTACWTEEYDTITITDGIFTVLLGTPTPIPDNCIISDTYLEITVNDETLTPRELINNTAQTLPDNATVRGRLKAVFENTGAVELTTPGGTAGIVFKSSDADNFRADIRRENGALTFLTHASTSGPPAVLKLNNDRSSLFFGDVSINGDITLGDDRDIIGTDRIVGHNDLRLYGNEGDTPDLYIKENGNIGVGTPNPTHGGVEIRNGAVPLSFEESGYTGIGRWWRMPLDGGNLRFDVSQNGTDFDGYITPFEMQQSGRILMRYDAHIGGDLSVGGSCSASMNVHSVASNDVECTGGSITTGAVIEANLQTPQEMRAKTIERFEKGDLLCWSTASERLERCDRANDRLVMAVADKNGKPIVMGAEPIKVIGKVVAGDILVASDTAGYAIVNNNPAPGTVIAQALENSNEIDGIIKAMIRKW